MRVISTYFQIWVVINSKACLMASMTFISSATMADSDCSMIAITSRNRGITRMNKGWIHNIANPIVTVDNAPHNGKEGHEKHHHSCADQESGPQNTPEVVQPTPQQIQKRKWLN